MSELQLALRLTGAAQRGHSTVAKAKEDYLTRLVATFVYQNSLHDGLKKLVRLREACVYIDSAKTGIKDNVITPVKATQVKQILRSLDRNARGFRQIHLLAQIRKGIIRVTDAMQQDEHIGRRIACRSCSSCQCSVLNVVQAENILSK